MRRLSPIDSTDVTEKFNRSIILFSLCLRTANALTSLRWMTVLYVALAVSGAALVDGILQGRTFLRTPRAKTLPAAQPRCASVVNLFCQNHPIPADCGAPCGGRLPHCGLATPYSRFGVGKKRFPVQWLHDNSTRTFGTGR
jgi:hypothetical protein